MGLGKVGAALIVVAALAALFASSAFAAATTTAANWHTGATEAEASTHVLSGEQAVTAQQSGTAKFTTAVPVTVPVEVSTTGVECVGCKISNSPTGATGTGKLKFTGVTVVKPTRCTVASSVETKALTFSADFMEGTSALVKLAPTTGEPFVTFELTGTDCPIAKIAGYVFAKAELETGKMKLSQTVSFSKSIQNAAEESGGPYFHDGAEEATLSATDILKAGGLFFGVM